VTTLAAVIAASSTTACRPAEYRVGVADVIDADDPIAAPHVCIRCSTQSLLSVVGYCAECVADMGLRNPDEYQVFKADVASTYGRK
jgi:hypothetical protein